MRLSGTFSRTNQLAVHACEQRALDEYQYHSLPENKSSYNPFGVTNPYRRGTDVPGYTGFVPGRYADGVSLSLNLHLLNELVQL